MKYNKIRFNLLLSSVLLCVAFFTIGGCTPNADCEKRARKKGTFNLCGLLNSSYSEKEKSADDICYSFEDLEVSECPAAEVLDICEPYLCEGCTGEFCFDFLFPDAFSGCEAIDCHTLDCDGVYGITIDGYPSWTILIENEEVEVNCHSQYW